MNLLTDPIVRIRTPDGPTAASLPELLALFGEDRVDSLTGIQRHQEDVFHIFCCYLAGAVLARTGHTDPVQKADFWREGIRYLTRLEGWDDDSPWILTVDDPTKPAFLQPPSLSRDLFEKDFKSDATTPDALDVLITSKNHDIKKSRAASCHADAWLFALVSLQTSVGLLGKGSGGGMNRGIGRMNSGYGSRPRIGWLNTSHIGPQFTRDVSILLCTRDELLRPPYNYHATGKILLWIYPWDGNNSHNLSELDPFFIEVARRVRLRSQASGIQAYTSGSVATFIAAEEAKGNLGDPWIPIDHRTNGALTVSESGLTPNLLRNLIFGDGFTPAPMQRADNLAGCGWFLASVLVRGQGKTEGFHSTTIRVPEKARTALLCSNSTRNRLAALSKSGLDTVSTIQNKALRPALFSLMGGGVAPLILDNAKIEKWVNQASEHFNLSWNPRYFEWLWSTIDISSDDEALRAWFDALHLLAQDTLELAYERAPQRHGRSYRAKARAQVIFVGSLKRNFSQFMEMTHENP